MDHEFKSSKRCFIHRAFYKHPPSRRPDTTEKDEESRSIVVVVVLLFYFHGKHLRSYRHCQLT